MKNKTISYILSLIAYLWMPVGVLIIHSSEPYILGLPLLLFHMVLSVFIGVVFLYTADKFNPDAREEEV